MIIRRIINHSITFGKDTPSSDLGNATWGNISGTISNQTDLMTKFSEYLKKSDDEVRLVSGEGNIVIGNMDEVDDGFRGLSLDEGILELYGESVNVKADHLKLDSKEVATQEWVNGKGYLTEHQSLAGYVKSTSLANTLTDYATRNWVDEEVDMILSYGDYATKSDIPTFKTINGQTITGSGDITITSDTEVDLTGYATQEWVGEQGYLTEHQSLADYALLEDLNGYATQDWVNGNGYATQDWVNENGFLTEHQSLKTINGESIVGDGDITITSDTEVDLTDYALKSEIPTNISDLTNDSNFVEKSSEGNIYANAFTIEDDVNGIFLTYMTDNSNYNHFAVDNGDGVKRVLVEDDVYTKDDIDEFNSHFVTQDQLNTYDYVSSSFLSSSGYITSADLDGYNYVTEDVLTDYALQSWVGEQGFLTAQYDDTNQTVDWDLDSFSVYGDNGISIQGGDFLSLKVGDSFSDGYVEVQSMFSVCDADSSTQYMSVTSDGIYEGNTLLSEKYVSKSAFVFDEETGTLTITTE